MTSGWRVVEVATGGTHSAALLQRTEEGGEEEDAKASSGGSTVRRPEDVRVDGLTGGATAPN